MFPAIERLIRECEESPTAAPNVDRVTDARRELDTYRMTSGVVGPMQTAQINQLLFALLQQTSASGERRIVISSYPACNSEA